MKKIEKSFNNPEYIKHIKQRIKHAKDKYVCVNCFETSARNIKKEDIIRIPKRTAFYSECDKCCYNVSGMCGKSIKFDKLGIGDYDDVPVTHRCEFGRTDRYGNIISMSELCCPVCRKPVHKIMGENVIISIIGSRDSGKSHYIGVLIHELMYSVADRMGWTILPEENTLRLYEANFERIFSTNQTLNLTSKNSTGFYEPYIFYIEDSKGKIFTLTLFDTAGEDFETDDLMENSAKHAFHASGIIFLADPLKIMNVHAALDDETVYNSSSVNADRAFRNDVILTILSNSLRKHKGIKDTKKIQVPIGVLIPKLDVISGQYAPHCACLFRSNHASRKAFILSENRRVNTEIRKWLSGLGDGAVNSFMSQMEINYSNYSYFGASALGMRNAPDRNGIFKAPKPHRIEDPVLWILKEKGFIPTVK